MKSIGMGILVFWLSIQSGFSQVSYLKDGDYEGRRQNGKHLHLLLKSLPEREGSFMGVLIEDDRAIDLYLIDPESSSSLNSFTMMPIMTTADGEIGPSNYNDNPSLLLTITDIKNETNFRFVINSANSNNESGFSGVARFHSTNQSKYEWVHHEAGEYDLNKLTKNRKGVSSGIDRALYLSPLSSVYNSDARFLVENLISGNFQIREKRPFIFTVNEFSRTATGKHLNQLPGYVGIFLKKSTWKGSETLFVLLNPSSRFDLVFFKKRD